MDFLYQGILDSNIHSDGGYQCYLQQDLSIQLVISVVLCGLSVLCIRKWDYVLQDGQATLEVENGAQPASSDSKHMNTKAKFTKRCDGKMLAPTKLELAYGICSLTTLGLTAYFKFITKKGLFMLNPCHITLGSITYLCLTNRSSLNMKIYHSMHGWLFGAYIALIVPHTEGIQQFQLWLFFIEHLLIVPFGPLVLLYCGRYPPVGRPTLHHHLVTYCTIVLYQVGLLSYLSRLSWVNLNYSLCPTDVDPAAKILGKWYVIGGILQMFTLGWVDRYIGWGLEVAVRSIMGINELTGATVNNHNSNSFVNNEKSSPRIKKRE